VSPTTRIAKRIDFWINSKTQFGLVVASYFLAWGFSLIILDAVFWDDWVFVDDPMAIRNHFLQAGAPWTGSFHLFFGYAPSTYSLITFFSFLAASLSFLGILRRAPNFLQLSPEQITFASVLFAIAPLNLARISGITVVYSLSVGLFFLAWYLWVATEKNSAGLLILVVTLFSLSFLTNSLLAFFAAPFFHKLVIEHSGGELGSRRTMIFRTLAFGALPFLWFAIFVSSKTGPFGFYTGYNSFALTLQLVSFSALLSFLTLSLIWIFYKLSKPEIVPGASWAWAIGIPSQLLSGLFLVALALFPYVAVGLIPPYSEWSTRHELLLSAGISILATALFGVAKKIGVLFGYSFAALVLLVSLSISMFFGIAAVVDWSKQRVLLDYWASSQDVLEAELVVVKDESRSLNLFQREYRFYEWSGQLRMSAGSDGPYALSNSESDLANLQSGFLMEYSLLGSGPAPSWSQNYLLVTIRTTCVGPIEALIEGVANCLAVSEEELTFKG
jgi:hypothetical protein